MSETILSEQVQHSFTAVAGPSTLFPAINRGYNSVFRPERLSLGLVLPLEAYPDSAVPPLENYLQRVKLAEELGFSAVWLRDVPFNVPSFGDAGQVFDPFVYLGFLAAQTQTIALGVASIILPLRHPAHVAKAAASVDQLSGGRLILGVASGDRPQEYPALNQEFTARGQRFRDSFEYIQQVSHPGPRFDNSYGSLDGSIDLLPKPTDGKLPLLITGGSQQEPEWIAQNGHGWMLYPRGTSVQGQIIEAWRTRLQESGQPNKPAMQPLYLDLLREDSARPRPIHLGLRVGTKYLIEHLHNLQSIGINHVALNLRFNQAPIETTLEYLAQEVLPEFN